MDPFRFRLLTLAHPLVQAARRRFEERKPKKRVHNFDLLFRLYCDLDNSWVDIATLLKMTPQGVIYMYHTWFRPLLGEREEARERHITGLTRAVQAQRGKEVLLFHPILGAVAAAAEKRGIRVEPLFCSGRRGTSEVSRSSLSLNDLRTRVHYLSNVTHRPNSIQQYARTKMSGTELSHHDLQILFLDVKVARRRFFVVPSEVLVDGREVINVDVPVFRRPVYRNAMPRVDYWRYLNAWPYAQRLNVC